MNKFQENEKQLLYLSLNQLTTGSTKHLYRLKNPDSERLNLRFQNGCNKVIIELPVVQFGLKSYL